VLVEDEASISEPLAAALQAEGFDVLVAGTGGEGLALVREHDPDIVLLDVMLPDIDGRDVCRTIRASSDVPIIMLTARGLETDRVVGLELGADDYVVKPFSVAELAARMRAVLRRSAAAASPEQGQPDALRIGDVELDERTWSVTLAGEPVTLARREFELLRLLMRNAGTVLTREHLMEEVWDPNWFGGTKTLDVHVSAVRRKLGDSPTEPRYIHTVRGVGFRFATPAELAT
jgi:two-component system, OmpR family, response regulator RegX3